MNNKGQISLIGTAVVVSVAIFAAAGLIFAESASIGSGTRSVDPATCSTTGDATFTCNSDGDFDWSANPDSIGLNQNYDLQGITRALDDASIEYTIDNDGAIQIENPSEVGGICFLIVNGEEWNQGQFNNDFTCNWQTKTENAPDYGCCGPHLDNPGVRFELFKDTDGDGVRDEIDECPGTPSEAPVNADDGCPIDSDGDGIIDFNDDCPNTGPSEVGLDANGCPRNDGDNDGVADSIDQCRQTPGTLSNGCPRIIERIVQVILPNFTVNNIPFIG